MPVKIFCYVPSVCIDSDVQISAQVRAKLRAALSSGLKPIGIPASTRDVAISLDEDQVEEVRRIGKAHGGMTAGRVVGGLLFALHWAKRLADDGAAEVAGAKVLPVTDGLRTGQIKVLEEAAPLLLGGRVVFSECGTGTGKARMIAHTAAFLLDARDRNKLPQRPYCLPLQPSTTKRPQFHFDYLQHVENVHRQRLSDFSATFNRSMSPDAFFERTACVVVAAPSIENVGHLVREWLAVRDRCDPKGLRQVGLRLGKRQFVNALGLELQLADIDPGAKGFEHIRKWLAKGMPAGETSTSKLFLSVEPGMCGLMLDLADLAKRDAQSGSASLDLDLTACALSDDVDCADEAAEPFQRHKDGVRTGLDIVFTTLAAVALDNLFLSASSRDGLLAPNVGALLIDEAHEMEPTQANLAAHSLSLIGIHSSLRQLRLVFEPGPYQTVSSQLDALTGALSGFQDQQSLPPALDAASVNNWQSAMSSMRSLSTELDRLLKPLTSSKKEKASGRAQMQLSPLKTHALQVLQRGVAVMKRVASGDETAARGILTRSPVKGYISLTFGPSSVSRHLSARWHLTPTVQLFSGSLYHIGTSGPNARFAAASLSALDRMAMTMPFMPSWLTSLPTLMQPGAETVHTFMPPTKDLATPSAMRYWLENVAKAIDRASRDAAGGMLVLMTGYERLNILASVIQTLHPDLAKDRLLVQSAAAGVGFCASEFKRMSQEGLRPIWLATGGAWTGLDLSDSTKDPVDDCLLTDLVIPAIPFGLEHNTTHYERLRRMGFVAEIMVAQRKLRQGLGRLIRRDGVQNRRIWMLDGRVLNPATSQRFADIRVVLQSYTRKVRF